MRILVMIMEYQVEYTLNHLQMTFQLLVLKEPTTKYEMSLWKW